MYGGEDRIITSWHPFFSGNWSYPDSDPQPPVWQFNRHLCRKLKDIHIQRIYWRTLRGSPTIYHWQDRKPLERHSYLFDWCPQKGLTRQVVEPGRRQGFRLTRLRPSTFQFFFLFLPQINEFCGGDKTIFGHIFKSLFLPSQIIKSVAFGKP